jgi:hypothetical protein
MVEQLIECQQVIQIFTCDVLEDLFSSIRIQVANDELEETGLDVS